MARGSDSNRHIGSEELPGLLEEFRRLGNPSLDLGEIHRHLTICSTCREQFEELAALDRQLLERPLMTMQPNESAPRSGDCPDATIWRDIAGGLTPPDQTLPLVEHASSCDLCGPLLRGAIAEFTALGSELSEAEYKQISELESARAPWQQKLAQRITSTPQPNPDRPTGSWWEKFRKGMSVPRLALAGSMAAVIAAGSLVVLYTNDYRNQPAEASRLLASAYTEKRTLELRIAGAAYAPLRVTRGPEASFTNRPAALLKAEALIAVQIASHPGDPAWLQAQAQADVLEGKYDAAVESLRRALELEPNSPAYRIDLATAYFQRAQASNRKEDLGAAYEHLSKALEMHPDDPVALFNRALVAEHQFLYHQALDDWNRYLQIDPHSAWSIEAREAAERVSTTLKNHDSSEALPLLSPAQIAAAVEKSKPPVEMAPRVIDGINDGINDRVNDGVTDQVVDKRIEEYLHAAVRTWLPQAFPAAGTNNADLVADKDASKAIFFLADLTSRQHGDRWLADLLRGSRDAHFPQAVNALARAAQANDAGDYDVSRQQAVLAEQLFAKSGNKAGALRAQFERIFADQLTRHSEDCRQESIAAEKQSRLYPYAWLQIQLELEQSVCSDLMDDLGGYEKIAERAQKSAVQAGYGLLYLRAVVFVGESKFNTGDASDGWKLINTGLEQYWSSDVPPIRGYGLYALLASQVEFSRQPNLRLALWQEGVDMIDADEDLRMRGAAHGIMAAAANEAHRPGVAKAQYRESERLYSLAPQTEAIRSLRLESEVRAIQVDLREGSSQNALSRLTAMHEQVQGISNDEFAQLFYSTLGEAQLRSHHAAEAEQAYRSALVLAERNLASLDSEAQRTRWSKDAAPVYLGLAEAELGQGREQESLDVFEWYLAAPERVGRGGRNSSPDRAPLHLPSISGRLPVLSDQTTLAFAALPDGVAVWVYDDRGVSSKWIPRSSPELEELAVDFSAQCSDPNSDLRALRRNSRHLYEALIAPSEEHLVPGRPLVIEAEGWLARVPFEALLDAKGHYLIERASLVHSLGQDSQSRLHSSAAISPDMPMLAVGSSASSAGDELGSLPDVSAEAQAVAGDFHSAQLLKGDNATLSAIQSDLPAAAVFHFAGHALSAPEKTGLLLQSEDGNVDTPRLMDAGTVRHLDTGRLQLAVLSACSTASGSGASGFDNIADAFVRDGVPHVVASRWPVDSAGTQAFIQDFYRNALSGQPVSEAIRLTSRKMMANPSTSHPYYWSEFAAYGRP